MLSPEVVTAQAHRAYLTPTRFAEYVTQATGTIVDDNLPQQLLVKLYAEEVLNHLKAFLIQEVFSGAEQAYAISPGAHRRLEVRIVSNNCFVNFVNVPKEVAFGEVVALRLIDDSLPSYPHLEASNRLSDVKGVCSVIINALLMSRFLRSLDESTLTDGQRKLLPDAEKTVFYWYEALENTFA